VNPGPETEAPLEAFLELPGVKLIYTHGHRDPELISPDNWFVDVHFLERPSAHRVQLDLFYDYRTNVELYPAWQAFLRERQPETLILWGQNDIFFTPEGGEAYLRDLPGAELIRLDTGHFAVEDRLDEIVDAILRFHAERAAARAARPQALQHDASGPIRSRTLRRLGASDPSTLAGSEPSSSATDSDRRHLKSPVAGPVRVRGGEPRRR
jgi:hypothetical protein